MYDVPDTPAQQLRREWSNKSESTVNFSEDDWSESTEFPAVNYKRDFNFKDCRSIVFLNGVRKNTEEDVILIAQGTGHMVLPAEVQVLVQAGYAKCAGNTQTDGSTVVGSGAHAPAPSRVGSDVAAFGRASSSVSGISSYASVPRSAGNDGFEVVEQADNYHERIRGSARGPISEVCSIAPSESISSVGNRGTRSNADSQWWN